MKTVTVRDLRNHFPKIESWLEGGEEIEVTKRGQPIAYLTPRRRRSQELVKPDFEKRLKKIWGDRVLTVEEIEAMRRDELAGEEG